MLIPLRVRTPLPNFTKPPVPVKSPLKVEETEPVVKVPLPRATVPAPSRLEAVVAFPLRRTVAPAATLSALLALSRFAPFIARVPPLTRVSPVKVLLPESVKVVPAPVLTSEPVPLMTPPKSLVMAPVVSVPTPRVTFPSPASAPILSENPARSRVVPLARVTAEASEIAPDTPSRKMPPLTEVEPV